MIRPVRPTKLPHAVALLAGVAFSVTLAGCDDHRSANQAAAQQELNAAGQNLKAAATETGAAIKAAAKDAAPAVKRAGRSADRGLANLTDATGGAAAKAGRALDTAGQKTEAAAHKAARHVREQADNTTE